MVAAAAGGGCCRWRLLQIPSDHRMIFPLHEIHHSIVAAFKCFFTTCIYLFTYLINLLNLVLNCAQAYRRHTISFSAFDNTVYKRETQDDNSTWRSKWRSCIAGHKYNGCLIIKHVKVSIEVRNQTCRKKKKLRGVIFLPRSFTFFYNC